MGINLKEYFDEKDFTLKENIQKLIFPDTQEFSNFFQPNHPPLLNSQLISQFLPHHPPFLFVDEVLGIYMSSENISNETFEKLGEQERDPYTFINYEIAMKACYQNLQNLTHSLVFSTFTAPRDHVIFEGHFPYKPIWPGVLQIEILAQNSIFALLPLFEFLDPNVQAEKFPLKVMLVKVLEARFKKVLEPNQMVYCVTVCKKVRSSFLEFQGFLFSSNDFFGEASFLAHIDL
jgi:3-hydroxymyristoyl/3-hydroxydecanoyl-(acyl carrier protein) dehydratase